MASRTCPCNPDDTGVEPLGWEGRFACAGRTMNELLIRSASGSPVSLEYGEVFKALQRNTVGYAFVKTRSPRRAVTRRTRV